MSFLEFTDTFSEAWMKELSSKCYQRKPDPLGHSIRVAASSLGFAFAPAQMFVCRDSESIGFQPSKLFRPAVCGQGVSPPCEVHAGVFLFVFTL